jgi:hypothetical protein
MIILFLLGIQELRFSIPVEKTFIDSGKIIVKILDENDRILSSLSRIVKIEKDIEYIPFYVKIKEGDPDLLRVKVIFPKQEKIFPLYDREYNR